MATTRIKDLSKTATTVNSDANLVLDGNTGGTQKITRDNFRQDTADAFVAAPGTYNLAPINSGTGKIDATYLPTSSDTPKGAWNASTNTPTLADGSGTAGDYYDVTVAGSSDLGSGSITFTVGDVVKYNGTTWFKIDSVTNILDGVSTIDGAKAAIEIPDVGTDPSEVPLNQHLGSMAYQSSDSVSVDKLEVTDKVDGSLSINNDNKSNYNSNGDDLIVGSGSGNQGITIASSGYGVLYFAKGTAPTGGDQYKAYINVNHADNKLKIATDSTAAITVDGSQRVGIGTDSPDNKLTIDSGDIQLQASKATDVDVQSINWKNTNSSGYDIARISAATGGNIYEGELKFLTKDSGGTMAARWTINSSGNLVSSGESQAIDLSGSNYAQIKLADNVNYALQVGQGTDPFVRVNTTNSAEKIEFYKNLYMSGNVEFGSGNGLDFSATSDGSGASNVAEIFDDYEAGRVSGAITTGTSGSITLLSGADTLEYTKIGRLVTVTGRLKVDSVSSPSGSCTIALPYAPTAGTDESGYCGGGVNYYDSSSGYSVIPWSVNAGTASLFLLNFASGAASGDWLNISITYAA